jgi:hypothetical protein
MLASPVVVLLPRNAVVEGLFDMVGLPGPPHPSPATTDEFSVGCSVVPNTKMPQSRVLVERGPPTGCSVAPGSISSRTFDGTTTELRP